MPTTIDFPTIQQGSSWDTDIALQDQNGNPVDLTGCTAFMQFRSQYHGVIYADLSIGNGITIDLETATITIALTPAQTGLFVMRVLIYDFDLIWPTGQTDTLFAGTVTIKFEVTIEPSADITATMDFSNPGNSGYLSLIFGGLFSDGTIEPPPAPSFDFSQGSNSGYLALIS